MSLNKYNIKIGSLITSYHKGYHRVIEIKPRYATEYDVKAFPKHYKTVGEEYSPIVRYVQVITDKFKVSKSKREYECDMAYCEPVTQERVDTMIKQYVDGLELLKNEIKK